MTGTVVGKALPVVGRMPLVIGGRELTGGMAEPVVVAKELTGGRMLLIVGMTPLVGSVKLLVVGRTMQVCKMGPKWQNLTQAVVVQP
jgi:hypothetical protein